MVSNSEEENKNMTNPCTRWPCIFDYHGLNYLSSDKLNEFINSFVPSVMDTIKQKDITDHTWKLKNINNKTFVYINHDTKNNLYNIVSTIDIQATFAESLDVISKLYDNDMTTKLWGKKSLIHSSTIHTPSKKCNSEGQLLLKKSTFHTPFLPLPGIFGSKFQHRDIYFLDYLTLNNKNNKNTNYEEALRIFKSIDVEDDCPTFYKGKRINRFTNYLGGYHIIQDITNVNKIRITFFGSHYYSKSNTLYKESNIKLKKIDKTHLYRYASLLSKIPQIILRNRLEMQTFTLYLYNTNNLLFPTGYNGICSSCLKGCFFFFVKICYLCGQYSCRTCSNKYEISLPTNDINKNINILNEKHTICSSCIYKVNQCSYKNYIPLTHKYIKKERIIKNKIMEKNINDTSTIKNRNKMTTSNHPSERNKKISSNSNSNSNVSYLSENIIYLLDKSSPEKKEILIQLAKLILPEFQRKKKTNDTTTPSTTANNNNNNNILTSINNNNNNNNNGLNNNTNETNDINNDDNENDNNEEDDLVEDECVFLESNKLRAYPLDFNWDNPYPKPPILKNDNERIKKLNTFAILDIPNEPIYDLICETACKQLDCQKGVITLIAKNKQFLKGKYGMSDVTEVPRDCSICAYTITSTRAFMIPNADADIRFVNNPLVTGDFNLKFYFGFPLITNDGFPLGTLCVIDSKPRPCITTKQYSCMKKLTKIVIKLIENGKCLSNSLNNHLNTIEKLNPSIYNDNKNRNTLLQNKLANIIREEYQVTNKIQNPEDDITTIAA